MGGLGSGRWSRHERRPNNPAKWGWANIEELEIGILQAMAEGAARKEVMHAYGLTRRQLEGKLFRLRLRLAYKNDMDMVCSGIRKGYLR